LKGARLGVLTTLFGSGPEYEEVNKVLAKAIDAMKKQGAVIVRVEDAALDSDTLTAKFRLNEPEFKAAIERNIYSSRVRTCPYIRSRKSLLPASTTSPHWKNSSLPRKVMKMAQIQRTTKTAG